MFVSSAERAGGSLSSGCDSHLVVKLLLPHGGLLQDPSNDVLESFKDVVSGHPLELVVRDLAEAFVARIDQIPLLGQRA